MSLKTELNSQNKTTAQNELAQQNVRLQFTLIKSLICDFFEQLKLNHVFGMSGANIDDLFYELSKRNRTQILLAKNEYNAAMMAIGSYLSNKKITAALTTSGAGLMNALPVLAEAYSSEVPFVLISGLIPEELHGLGGFQDTSGKSNTLNHIEMFKPCTVYCQVITNANDVLVSLTDAFEAAQKYKRPAALFIPKNIFNQSVNLPSTSLVKNSNSNIETSRKNQVQVLINNLFEAKSPPMVVLGEELVHLKDDDVINTFISRTNSKVGVTPVAKGFYDHSATSFCGVTGMMGHPSFLKELQSSDLIIFIGTRFDFLSRFGMMDLLNGKKIIFINEFYRDLNSLFKKIIPDNAEKTISIHEIQDNLTLFLTASIKELEIATSVNTNTEPMASHKIPNTHSVNLNDILNFQNSFQLLNRFCCSPNADVDIFVDAGNTGAFATHYLNPKGKNIFYISLGMGGMGNSIGAAMGSCFASGKKTYVLVGDGAFLMYGLEIHTALQHQLPIVFVVFNNNSHGMCSTREDIFLGPQSGINNFTKTFFAQGFKNMFSQLQAAEVNSLSELNSALQQMHPLNTTSLISVNLAVNTEVPPFQSFIKHSSIPTKNRGPYET